MSCNCEQCKKDGVSFYYPNCPSCEKLEKENAELRNKIEFLEYEIRKKDCPSCGVWLQVEKLGEIEESLGVTQMSKSVTGENALDKVNDLLKELSELRKEKDGFEKQYHIDADTIESLRALLVECKESLIALIRDQRKSMFGQCDSDLVGTVLIVKITEALK